MLYRELSQTHAGPLEHTARRARKGRRGGEWGGGAAIRSPGGWMRPGPHSKAALRGQGGEGLQTRRPCPWSSRWGRRPLLPSLGPRGPRYTGPGRLEGQTPSGRPRPGGTHRSPGLGERRLWQGPGPGEAGSGAQGRRAVSRRPGRRPRTPRPPSPPRHRSPPVPQRATGSPAPQVAGHRLPAHPFRLAPPMPQLGSGRGRSQAARGSPGPAA